MENWKDITEEENSASKKGLVTLFVGWEALKHANMLEF